MIIEVFESANSNDAVIEIEIKSVEVSRVLPFNENVGERISKEKLKSLLNEVRPSEDLNMDEPESYFAPNISVWLDGNLDLDQAARINIPHHIAVRLVLESVLEKYKTYDDLQILIG